MQWICQLTLGASTAYIDPILKIEETAKASDRFIEQIEEDLIDDDVSSSRIFSFIFMNHF